MKTSINMKGVKYIVYFILAVVTTGILIYHFYIEKFTEDSTEIAPKIASDEQLEDAFDYAIIKIAKEKGYSASIKDGQLFIEHTKETCNRDSAFPSTDTKIYMEWKDGNCVLGNEAFRQFCSEKKLDFNSDTLECKTNRAYCREKDVAWDNNDCKTNGSMDAGAFFFGDTITRQAGKFIGTSVGRCQTPPCKKGEGCLGGAGDCDDGLFCGASSVCVDKKAVGAYCPSDNTYCASGNCGPSSTCLDENGKAGIDALCIRDSECVSNNCLGKCRPPGETGNVVSVVENTATGLYEATANTALVVADGAVASANSVANMATTGYNEAVNFAPTAISATTEAANTAIAATTQVANTAVTAVSDWTSGAASSVSNFFDW
jgi:hypothetical protein